MDNRASQLKSLCEHILAAKTAWEAAGGSINDTVTFHREWADRYASHVGCRLEWHSIHPAIHWPDGSEQTWAEFNRSVSDIR